MTRFFDVSIIGGGVIGSALARELSRFQLRVAVFEKEPDVCSATSGRNSAVLHAGFNNKTGSLMARFCVEGSLSFADTAAELAVPFRRTGKVVVGFTSEDLANLQALKAQGDRNGCPGLEMIDEDRLHQLAPTLDGRFALYSPLTGILNPFLYTIALAENAHANGVAYFLDHTVTAISRSGQDGEKPPTYEIATNRGLFHTRWLINCAGLYADTIARMLGITDYTIYPCRGQYFILDKKLSPYLNMPAYPVPNAQAGGLGIHLTPTIDGTILIGPSAEYIDDKDDYASTQPVMDMLLAEGRQIFPHVTADAVIRSYAGIRPKLAGPVQGGYADFVIERRPSDPRAIHLIGIESPGLTSAGPLARHVVNMIREQEDLAENEQFDPRRPAVRWFNEMSPDEQAALIACDPDHGEIICRCETVTRAEILAALRNPLGVATVMGIKLRTRAMAGRCQGGYCQTRITEMIMAEKGLEPAAVTLSGKQSQMFVGRVRP